MSNLQTVVDSDEDDAKNITKNSKERNLVIAQLQKNDNNSVGTSWSQGTGTNQTGGDSNGLYRLASSALAMSHMNLLNSNLSTEPFSHSSCATDPFLTLNGFHHIHSNGNGRIAAHPHNSIYGLPNQNYNTSVNLNNPPKPYHQFQSTTGSTRFFSQNKTRSTMAGKSSSSSNINKINQDKPESKMKQKRQKRSRATSPFESDTQQDDSEEPDQVKPPPSGAETAQAQLDTFKEMRMERKRKREMQRRSNVNKELDNLAELITNINPPELRRPLNDKNSEDSAQAPLNRLELIHVAVKVMERLHLASVSDADRINKLTQELNAVREKIANDKVTMMFPIMVPSNQIGRTGDPIPNGSVFLPPRIPNNFLNGHSFPSLYNAPPFPPNSFFSSIPSDMNINNSCEATSSSLPALSQKYNIEPHFVFAPDPGLLTDHNRGENQRLNLDDRELEAILAAKVAEHIATKNHSGS